MAWTLSAFSDEAAPSCDDQIKALQAAGFHYIDIRSIDGINVSVLPLDHARQIRGKLDDAGIAVQMLGSPIGKIDLADDFTVDLEKLRHLAVLAPILNCNCVRIFSYFNRKAPKATADYHREALDRLRQLTVLAQNSGLVLYHENEADIMGDKASDVRNIAQELRQKFGAGKGVFRMIFDFGNFHHARENIWDNWLLLRDATDGFHIKDALWVNGEQQHVPAGQGETFVEKILADAAARGWQGPVAVEPHLVHSAAVVVTGPSGVPNQAYSQMSCAESFQIACLAAKSLCQRVGAEIQ